MVKVTQGSKGAAAGFRQDKSGYSLAAHFEFYRQSIIEECARVAESRHETWNSGVSHNVQCDVSACENIATAIRKLKGE